MLRRINFLAMLLLGSLWAGTLLIVGAMVVARPSPSMAPMGHAGIAVGLTFITAGQFVFAVVVADRLFPMANRVLTTRVELGLGVTLAGGVLLSLIMLITGAGL
ncbi:MAG: hypothetical protein EA376_10525 [Phycisphaeraceae bacterium]|nr:MAG: hypothetical protein EA376_10525 [Phycisphaeraceae bacterium]